MKIRKMIKFYILIVVLLILKVLAEIRKEMNLISWSRGTVVAALRSSGKMGFGGLGGCSVRKEERVVIEAVPGVSKRKVICGLLITWVCLGAGLFAVSEVVVFLVQKMVPFQVPGVPFQLPGVLFQLPGIRVSMVVYFLILIEKVDSVKQSQEKVALMVKREILLVLL
jgi:hypothetical protein